MFQEQKTTLVKYKFDIYKYTCCKNFQVYFNPNPGRFVGGKEQEKI